MGAKDKTLENIKKGKGLKPLPEKSKKDVIGLTISTSDSEQGISYLKHSLDESKKEKR